MGSRANHGVIIDFINKLETDPKRLEILGDGTQKKSYLHIEDFIDATLHVTDRFLDDGKKADVYNVGSVDQVEVKKIAEMKMPDLNAANIEAAMRMVEGTARSMGIVVK